MRWPWQRIPKAEQPENLISIQDPVLASFFGIGQNHSGVQVGEATALGIPAMYRACALVSSTIAQLPLRTLRDTAAGQRQRVASWLDDPAGPTGQTAFGWKQTIVLHLMLHGEAFLAHLFNQAGTIIGAVPIHPLAVTEEPLTRGVGDFGAPMPRWTVTLNDGTRRTFTPATMTKILGLSLDGVHGLSVISVARQSLGTTVAGDRAAANMFSNGGLIRGLVTPEEDVDEEEAKEIKAKLDQKMSGWENAGELALVNRKLKFTPWQMSAEDAQFLQSRQFQIEEIARWTGVPPHLLMQTEKQTSWGTGVAEQNRGLARFTLPTWTGTIEQTVSRMLRDPLFAEFDFAGLERPTPEQEIDLLIKQVDAGLITPNEARRIRNMPPIDGGDELRTTPAAPDAAPAPQSEETPVNVWNSADLSKMQSLADRGRKLLRDHQLQNKHSGDGWYRIENAGSDERAQVFIYGYVGDEFDGGDAGTFLKQLRAITAPAIDLSINSPGGLVFDGVAIYSALKNHAATVDVSVDGLAASTASFIAMSGDSIAIEKPAKMMIHDAAGLVIGNAADMLEMATLLDELSDTIAEIYADRAGGTVEDWRQRMRDETWFSSAEAVEAGLADQVLNDTKTSPATDRGERKVHAAAWNTLTTGGKGMEIDEILAAMKQIIDGADGRTLTDEEVKRYEALEGDLANKRTESVKARQHAYEAPAPENAQLQQVVHVAPAKQDDGLEKAFENYLRTGKPNADIADLRVTNAQSSGTDSEGGFTVPEGFRQKLVEVMEAFGGLAAAVESFPTETGNPIEYPSNDDTANEGTITAENAAITGGADLVFGTIVLGAYKYTSAGGGNAPLKVSVELLQDSAFDIAALVARKLGTRIARKQASDWVTGAGTTLPFGIAHAGLTPDHSLTTAGTITYQELLDLETTLDPAYEQSAQWAMNKTVWNAVRGVTDNDGRPLVWENAQSGMGGAPNRMLLGYPVLIDQAFPGFGDAAHIAVLGDLAEAYVIRRVSNLAVVVNPFSSANNGQVEYTAWERADGNIQNRPAYSLLADQDVASSPTSRRSTRRSPGGPARPTSRRPRKTAAKTE